MVLRSVPGRRREPAEQGDVKVSGDHGFGYEVVHSGGQTCSPVFIESVGRHRKDRQVRVLGLGTNSARCDQPIHLWHLYVHQHQVVPVIANFLQCFATILCRVY